MILHSKKIFLRIDYEQCSVECIVNKKSNIIKSAHVFLELVGMKDRIVGGS